MLNSCFDLLRDGRCRCDLVHVVCGVLVVLIQFEASRDGQRLGRLLNSKPIVLRLLLHFLLLGSFELDKPFLFLCLLGCHLSFLFSTLLQNKLLLSFFGLFSFRLSFLRTFFSLYPSKISLFLHCFLLLFCFLSLLTEFSITLGFFHHRVRLLLLLFGISCLLLSFLLRKFALSSRSLFSFLRFTLLSLSRNTFSFSLLLLSTLLSLFLGSLLSLFFSKLGCHSVTLLLQQSFLLFFPELFGHFSGFAISFIVAFFELVVFQDLKLFFEVLEFVVSSFVVLDFSFCLRFLGMLVSFEPPLIPLPGQ